MKPSDNYKSFRVAGQVNEILDDPAQLIVLAGLVMLSLVSFQVAQAYLGPVNNINSSAVLGEAASRGQALNLDPEVYRLSIKSLLSDYLTRRADYLALLTSNKLTDKQLNNWQSLLGNLNRQLLDLRVPSRYQALHLQIVIALTEEEKLLTNISFVVIGQEFAEINKRWQNILFNYPWLNE